MWPDHWLGEEGWKQGPTRQTKKHLWGEIVGVSCSLHHLCLSLLSTFCPCLVSGFLTNEGKTMLHFALWQLGFQQRYLPSRVISEYILLLILLSETLYSFVILYPNLGNHPLKRCHELPSTSSPDLSVLLSPFPFFLPSSTPLLSVSNLRVNKPNHTWSL